MPGTVILFEDQFIDEMQPVSLTRPAFAVTCAAYNLHEIVSMACGHVGWIVQEHLKKTTRKAFGAPKPPEGRILLLNASVAPDVRYLQAIRDVMASGKPCIVTSGQRVAAALLPSGTPLPENLTSETVTGWLLGLNLPLCDEEMFRTIDLPFQIIRDHVQLFPENIRARAAEKRFKEVRPGLFVGNDVQISQTAVFVTTDGPIVLDDNVQVMDFTYFRGPLYIGLGSRVIERSSVKETTSIGATCKVGGEVEGSVIESYTNKQHHGFLGHAWVGSWVNLGAGTSNSDMKNTYGEIRLEHRGRRVDTGMQFFGCVIGDFSKSAINTSIFTGKTVGVASMLYGYVGQNVPSFCNYAKSFGQVTECPVDQAIVTQKRMFERRSVKQTHDDVELLKHAFDLTREERMISSDLPVL